jgi:hypothetical protein
LPVPGIPGNASTLDPEFDTSVTLGVTVVTRATGAETIPEIGVAVAEATPVPPNKSAPCILRGPRLAVPDTEAGPDADAVDPTGVANGFGTFPTSTKNKKITN